jgi:hypothetical protein
MPPIWWGGAPTTNKYLVCGQSSQVASYVSQDDVNCDVLDNAKVCEENVYSCDGARNVSQNDVKCDALDYVKYEASPNAQPNRSMSVAELSQMRCANKMSSANISSEQARNISFTACLKNLGCKPKMQFEVQTTSRG